MRCKNCERYKEKLNQNLTDMATKLPKIKFVYSLAYDDVLKELNQPPKTRNFSYQAMQGYADQVGTLWRKQEKAILQELSKITRLPWKEKEIPCYVVTWIMAFSEPLTIAVWRSKDYFLDILTHELIHRLFTQEGNAKRADRIWKYFFRKYRHEPLSVRIHIPTIAIHEYIFLKLFNEKRLQRMYAIAQDGKEGKAEVEYKRAWNIVRKEGYQNIIKQFVDRIA